MSESVKSEAQRKKAPGAPLPEDLRQQLLGLAMERRIAEFAQRSGLSRNAVQRAVNGRPVYAGTVALVRAALAADAIPPAHP